MEITLRLAGAGDLESLVRLAVVFRDHLEQAAPSADEFRTWFAALLRDPATEFLLACDAAGGAVAYVQLRYRPSAWVAGVQAEIEDVFVSPEARRRAIGRRLLTQAITRAGEKVVVRSA